MSIRYGNGGWCCVQQDRRPSLFYVRLLDDGERLRICEVYVRDIEGLMGNDLREIPFGRVEAAVNGSDARESFVTSMDIPSPDLDRAIGYFDQTFGSGAPRTWVVDMLDAQYPTSDVPQQKRRRDPAPIRRRSEDLDLELPKPADGRDYGDDFYRAVGAKYRLAGEASNAPAKAIASANGVPVSTVYRWIKETRRRGILGPGHKGKAG